MTMQDRFIQALRAGNERIVAWADILDEINVYPVPDGDTGRNLVITLGCLRDADREPEDLARLLVVVLAEDERGFEGRPHSVFTTFTRFTARSFASRTVMRRLE